MVINSKFLEVPRSYYQRHLNASRVKRIAAEFDERIANAPKVSYRDGHYYVFDGQHTIAARKLLNNNSDLNIVCKVYSGLTEQEEALLFAQQTGISAPLTAGAKLRAKIHGGDPEAIAFQSATQRAGFGLSSIRAMQNGKSLASLRPLVSIGSMANAFIRRLSVFWPKHGKATLIRFDPRYCKALSVSSLCTITNTTRCG